MPPKLPIQNAGEVAGLVLHDCGKETKRARICWPIRECAQWRNLTRRDRKLVSGPLECSDLRERSEGGWKLVAIEWEREVEGADDEWLTEVPFGLRIASDSRGLEQNPAEREILLRLMELIVQEGSYAYIADEINRRGLRTRQGEKWTPISVFEILTQLIEVGPQLFQSEEWQKRRQHIAQEH